VNSSNKGYISITAQPGGYVEFDPNVMAVGTNPFTFSLWMRKHVDITRPSIADMIGNRYNASCANSFSAGLYGGYLSVSLFQEPPLDQSGCAGNVGSQRGGLDDNQWHFYAIVRSGAVVAVYVDGVFSGSITVNWGQVVDLVADQPFRMGWPLDQVSSPNADFDELMMFDSALSSTDILNLYNWVSRVALIMIGFLLFLTTNSVKKLECLHYIYHDSSRRSSALLEL